MTLDHHPASGTFLPDIEKNDSNEEKSRDASIHGSQHQDISASPTVSHGKDEEMPNNAEQTVNVSDWNGPDDPDNPHTWSTMKKAYHATVPALFGFAVLDLPPPPIQTYHC